MVQLNGAPEMITKREIEIILNSTRDAMVAVNEHGIVTLFNAAAERILGIRAENVVGRPVVEVIPNTRLHMVLTKGVPELDQHQHVDNTSIVTNRMPVRDEEGRVVGAVAVFRDVTEIDALTRQVSDLWKVRNLLEAVIEATEDAISVADDKGMNIIVNPAYTRITGLPKEAVINKPAAVDIAEGESMHMKVLQDGKPVRNVRLRVGPMKKEVIVNVAPIFIDGAIKGSVGVIHDISEIMKLTEELAQAKKIIRHLKARYTFDDIVAESAAMQQAIEQARNAAHTPATVLLRGESGTGKELFAHAIHSASERRRGQFVRVNCAALAGSLLESELFGYEEGAFTGALKGGRKGLFEEAHNGTIFLDEIGEIGPSLQTKLLRVLQEKEVVRVGGTTAVPVNVRVISATNANLEQKVREGTFRDDLYYRLNVFPITIPPLRERREDIPALAEHIVFKLNQEFGRQIRNIAGPVMARLQNYPWPGNVREMENVLGRAIIDMLPQDATMEHIQMPSPQTDSPGAYPGNEPSSAQTLERTIAEAEKQAIMRALEEAKGNKMRAATILGIAIRSLYYKMARHGLR